MQTQPGFFKALFDTSFRSFVTTRIVSVLFIISIVLAGIYAIFVIATAFANDPLIGLVALILSPLVFLLMVLYSRVLLEVFVVLFRIQENTRRMADSLGVDPATATTQPNPPPPSAMPENPMDPS